MSERPGRTEPSRGHAAAGASRAPRAVGALAALALLAGAVGAHALPYGVNAHLPSPELLDAARAAGIEWIRIDVSWATVEPAQDAFDWHVVDAVVDGAMARGLRIFATVGDTPAWATSGDPGRGVPADAMDWYDVCYRAAARYRGRIDHWGMWNEPNSPRFWAGSRAQYIDTILRTGSRAVHAANPAARVCGPEISHLQSQHWNDWLWDVLAQASDALDVVTMHLYTDGSATALVSALENDEPLGNPAVKSILAKHGWLGRPFWLTETGVDTAASTSGEQVQASFVTGLFNALFGRYRVLPWVHKVFLYELVDDPRYPDRWGLLTASPELRHKLAFTALQSLTARLVLDDAEPIRVAVPAAVAPGETVIASVTMRNTGTTTWRGEDGVALAAWSRGNTVAAPFDALPAGVAVAPGQELAFAVPVAAGDQPLGATLVAAWQMTSGDGSGFGELLRRTVTVGDALPPPLFVPAAAHADGRLGTRWRTDLVLRNPSPGPIEVTVFALEQGRANDEPRRAVVAVDPASSLRIDDAVARLFGLAATVALRIEASRAGVQVSTRTYTARDAGTWGDFIPAVAAPAVPAGTAWLVGLARDPDDAHGVRTNLALVNTEGRAASVDIELNDGDGASLGTQSYRLPTAGFLMVNDVFAARGATSVRDGVAVVRPRDGARVLACASVVDNGTGDTTFVVPAAPAPGALVVAAAARTSGLGASQWRSDVRLHNPTSTDLDATVELLDGSEPPPARTIAVPAGRTLKVADILAALFGTTGVAALRVSPAGDGLVVAGRTYDATPAGDFGQLVPSVSEQSAPAGTDEVALLQLSRSTDPSRASRTNIGVVNLAGIAIGVRVDFYRSPDVLLGTAYLAVPPNATRLLVDAFGRYTSLDVPDGCAVVRATTSGARFVAYASVVDGRTGDPSFTLGATR